MIDLTQLKFFSTQSHPCSYLSDETAKTIFLDPNQSVEKDLYSSLLQHGFRRSGDHIYRPHCDRCQQCISVRVPTHDFTASKQQQRVIRKNQALTVKQLETIDNEACYQLFEKYINIRHADGDMYPANREAYREFLCKGSAISTYYAFHLKGNLVGIAICDKVEGGLSAVYSFYDPDHDKLSLGTYMILWQIEECNRLKLNALYLGYWIKNCQKMNYKSKFRPLELYLNHRWVRMN